MVKKILKRIVFGYKASSDSYVRFLKNKGVSIGKGIEISFPSLVNVRAMLPQRFIFLAFRYSNALPILINIPNNLQINAKRRSIAFQIVVSFYS